MCCVTYVFLSILVPTFSFHLSAQTLDKREHEEDDERGHADASERFCSTCKTGKKEV